MDRTTRIWNVATGKASEVITASEGFSQLAFTPDGKLFIDCDGKGKVIVVNAATNKTIHSWLQKSACLWFAVSDNRYILSTSAEELIIYDRETGTHRNAEIPMDGHTLVSCRAAREGTIAILHMRKASADGINWEDSITFIDCATGTVVKDSRTHVFNTMIWNFATNYNGSAVVLALHEAPPEMRHISDPSRDAKFHLGGTYATGIAISPDERLLVVADPVGTVTVVETATFRPAFYPIRHPDRLEEILVSWDGRYLLTSTSKIATVWDLAVGPALPLPIGFTPDAGSSVISGDRLRIHLGNSIDWLDINSLETKIEVRFPHADPSEIISEDLTVCATYMPDKSMEFHSIVSEPPVKLSSWISPGGMVNYWELSNDGSTFAGTDEKGVIHFADTASGKSISSVEIPGLRMGEMLFTPDGRHMVVASKLAEDPNSASRVFLIDVRAGKMIPSQTTDIYTPVLRISDNSRYIAIAGNPVSMAYSPQILVWDSGNLGKAPVAITHPNAINDFRFSPDSSLLALAGADMVARVFDTTSFRQAAEPITATFAPFSLLSFSPDSTMLATAAAGHTSAEACVWNWREAKQISTSFVLPVSPSAMHFSEDGRKLVAIRATSAKAGSKGCTVHTVEIMPPDEIVSQILPLTEAVTAHRIRRGELPSSTDPLQSWDIIRKDFPNSWFLSDPAKRTISPGFTIPSARWMDNKNVGIEALLSAMPAVSIANASISHWEQVSLGKLENTLSTLEPGSTEHAATSERIAATKARIARLIAFAERNARTDPAVCYHLSQQARQAGNIDRAVEYARKAIALDPAHEDSLHLLAIIYQDQEKSRDSILLFRKLKELFPDKPVYRLRLGLGLHKAGEEKEALPLLESIVGSTELDADDRALSLVILGRADEALPLFKTLAEDQKRLSPDSTYSLDSLVHIITAYHRTGNTAEAVAHYRMLIAVEARAASRSIVEALTIHRIYVDSLLATLDATLKKHPELAPPASE
jgi:WD40 repeat protein/tetratricopeptide (TPR) repeat protein